VFAARSRIEACCSASSEAPRPKADRTFDPGIGSELRAAQSRDQSFVEVHIKAALALPREVCSCRYGPSVPSVQVRRQSNAVSGPIPAFRM